MGDFNARITPGPRFCFNSYPHKKNNNGDLLNAFADQNDLHCLNPMSWNGITEEKPTYQRYMGTSTHVSLIDYFLASTGFCASVFEAKVTDEPSLSVNSDHSTLCLSYFSHRGTDSMTTGRHNPLRAITHWNSFNKILSKRLVGKESWFSSLPVASQGSWLTAQLTAAGKSTLSSLKPVNLKPSLMRNKLSSLHRRILKTRSNIRKASTQSSRPQVKLKRLHNILRYLEEQHSRVKAQKKWEKKLKIRNAIRKGGPAGSKLFWECISDKTKSSSKINALTADNGEVTYEVPDINTLIEKSFVAKFKCASSPPSTPQATDVPGDEVIGVPDVCLSDEQARKIVRPFTLHELNSTLNTLVEEKANGLDNITNAMLKNSGPEARLMILELFNNVLQGGVNPDEWKVGDVILVLKRPPSLDVTNYRPITLISCLSKVLTKILAKRITTAVDESGLAGDLQNGFRPKRSCSDNIFILNSMLDLNKQKKLLSYLMFVDLSAAYDMVDRGILFRKMEQLNFPTQLITFLREYYFEDCVSTAASGVRTKSLFLTRGLRQGCNLSAILFVIYLSELSRRLNCTKLGVELSPTLLLAYLLFADDIVLAGTSEAELKALKTVLEIWCIDFRMKIGTNKTQLVTPSSVQGWSVLDTTSGDLEELVTVDDYRYLGIHQKLTLRKTSNEKCRSMVTKARSYAKTILRLKSTLPDKTEVYRSIWDNIAMPAILYGADVLPIDPDTITEIQTLQRIIGKSILGVPKSSANEVVELELGLKPVLLRVLTSKIKFLVDTSSDTKACQTTKMCLGLLKHSGNSEYLKNFDILLEPFGLSTDTVTNDSIKQITQLIQSNILENVRNKPSLSTIPLTGVFWKPSIHVAEGLWSTYLTRFRCQNAGLGNRSDSHKYYSSHDSKGRVVQCPLCYFYRHGEIHILVECLSMESSRRSIKTVDNKSLRDILDEITTQHPSSSPTQIARFFLGQQSGLKKSDYVSRGRILIHLVEAFFSLWDSKCSRRVPRPIE